MIEEIETFINIKDYDAMLTRSAAAFRVARGGGVSCGLRRRHFAWLAVAAFRVARGGGVSCGLRQCSGGRGRTHFARLVMATMASRRNRAQPGTSAS